MAKTDQEKTFIEASVNTVRVSVSIRKGQAIDVLLTAMLERFMALRADRFDILRKCPINKDYDFSFLISNDHLLKYKKEEIINFIIEFIHKMEEEINSMRIRVNNSARFAAAYF